MGLFIDVLNSFLLHIEITRNKAYIDASIVGTQQNSGLIQSDE